MSKELKFNKVPELNEIVWEVHPIIPFFELSLVTFPNGYGANIIRVKPTNDTPIEKIVYHVAECLGGNIIADETNCAKDLSFNMTEQLLTEKLKELFSRPRNEIYAEDTKLWEPYLVAKKLLES